MTLRPISSPPDPSTLQSITDYQSSTPPTFFSGPAILHYTLSRATLVLLSPLPGPIPAAAEDCNGHDDEAARPELPPAVAALFPLQSSSPSTIRRPEPSDPSATSLPANGTDADMETEADGEEGVQTEVSVNVTSRALILFSPSQAKGVEMGYRTVAVHARRGGAVYIQLVVALDEGDERPVGEIEDEGVGTVEIEIRPGDGTDEEMTRGHGEEGEGVEGVNGVGGGDGDRTEGETERRAQALYDAISACADLVVDSMDQGDEAGGGLGGGGGGMMSLASMLAAGGDLSGGGWITADNVDEYLAERGDGTGTDGQDGDAGEDAMTATAGTRRLREDEDIDGEHDTGDGEETKWRRTG